MGLNIGRKVNGSRDLVTTKI